MDEPMTRQIQGRPTPGAVPAEEWLADGGGALLVARLRAALRDEAAVARVLHIISTTCRVCWDTDTSGGGMCFCWRDE